jgi:hypothetical protein
MYSIEQLVEAIIAKTHLMISTAQAWQQPQIIEQRIKALDGMLELAHWREETQLENDIELHIAELDEQLDTQYGGMRVIALALPPEFIRLCESDGVKPEIVLRGFIADLCGIMNWSNHPRVDGYSSNGSDERRLAEEYYERVGYPWMHRNP